MPESTHLFAPRGASCAGAEVRRRPSFEPQRRHGMQTRLARPQSFAPRAAEERARGAQAQGLCLHVTSG